MMSRQDYVLIARALRDDAAHLAQADFDYSNATPWERGASDQWHTTVLAISRALAATNPAFQVERFLAAAGFPVVER